MENTSNLSEELRKYIITKRKDRCELSQQRRRSFLAKHIYFIAQLHISFQNNMFYSRPIKSALYLENWSISAKEIKQILIFGIRQQSTIVLNSCVKLNLFFFTNAQIYISLYLLYSQRYFINRIFPFSYSLSSQEFNNTFVHIIETL